MTEQIKLVQAPVITHDLVSIGKSVTERLEALNLEWQVVTEDTVQTLKKLRAGLNTEFKEYEEQRKTVKTAVMNPYNEFDEVYKTEISDKFKAADETLKNKIGDFENNLKEAKKLEVVTYFAELCIAENVQWLTFDRLGIEIKLSDSLKSLKDKCFDFVSKVIDEINLIKTNQYEAEIMVEYRKTLNAAKAIREIQDRKQAEKLELDRIKLQENQRRQSLLVNMSIVYRDMTQSYNYVSDESIYILNSELESISKDEFNKRLAELESKIEQYKKSIVPEKKPLPLGDLLRTMAEPVTSEPAPVEPLKAPIVEQPKEPIVPARFECFGTMAQLIALGQYMKQNNITYKNI